MIKIDINFEFRKGVLFIRLRGVLNKNTIDYYQKNIIEMIKNNGIKNVVLNLKKVYKIDLKGMNLLFYTYEIIRQNKGTLMFTNINELIKERINKSHILKYVKVIDNELVAFDKIIV